MDIKKLLARTFVNGSKEQYIHDTISIIPAFYIPVCG